VHRDLRPRRFSCLVSHVIQLIGHGSSSASLRRRASWRYLLIALLALFALPPHVIAGGVSQI
jgi:hypothetical protein